MIVITDGNGETVFKSFERASFWAENRHADGTHVLTRRVKSDVSNDVSG
jgi:hypothetical protein